VVLCLTCPFSENRDAIHSAFIHTLALLTVHKVYESICPTPSPAHANPFSFSHNISSVLLLPLAQVPKPQHTTFLSINQTLGTNSIFPLPTCVIYRYSTASTPRTCKQVSRIRRSTHKQSRPPPQKNCMSTKPAIQKPFRVYS
jgi:hypothetical protein